MKKTIIRIVAVAMLALMVLTALPAFAYNIVGTAAAQTPVYKDTKGRKVELYVSGPVTINRQDNKSGMYNVTVSYDGKTYTGWVYPSAISGIGYDKSTGGSASGSTSGTTGGTTSGVTGTYTATIATGAAINVNGTNYPVSVGGSINVNYRDAAGTQVNVTVGNVTGWVAASSLSGFRRNGSSISLSDLPTNGGNTIGGTTSPTPAPTPVRARPPTPLNMRPKNFETLNPFVTYVTLRHIASFIPCHCDTSPLSRRALDEGPSASAGQ